MPFSLALDFDISFYVGDVVPTWNFSSFELRRTKKKADPRCLLFGQSHCAPVPLSCVPTGWSSTSAQKCANASDWAVHQHCVNWCLGALQVNNSPGPVSFLDWIVFRQRHTKAHTIPQWYVTMATAPPSPWWKLWQKLAQKTQQCFTDVYSVIQAMRRHEITRNRHCIQWDCSLGTGTLHLYTSRTKGAGRLAEEQIDGRAVALLSGADSFYCTHLAEPILAESRLLPDPHPDANKMQLDSHRRRTKRYHDPPKRACLLSQTCSYHMQTGESSREIPTPVKHGRVHSAEQHFKHHTSQAILLASCCRGGCAHRSRKIETRRPTIRGKGASLCCRCRPRVAVMATVAFKSQIPRLSRRFTAGRTTLSGTLAPLRWCERVQKF